MVAQLTRDTLTDIQRAVGVTRQGQVGDLRRMYNLGFGDINYDLQKPAKQTEVYYFPILALMPHVLGNGGDRTNYKVIDKINTNLVEGWLPEGARQQRITSHLNNLSQLYATFGLEDAITDEAKGASFNFEDAMSRMQTNLLLETQRRLERAVTWADATVALAQPTQPTLADVPTGGHLAPGTQYFVGVIALTAFGVESALNSLSGTVWAVPQPATIVGPDGKTVVNGFGATQISTLQNTTTAADANTTHRVSAWTPVVSGAVGYAWYIGTSATTVYLMAVTTTNNVILDGPIVTTHQEGHLLTNNYSNASQTFGGVTNSGFDGLLTQAFANGTVIALPTGTPGTGSGLTSDGAGGIVEIETLFQTLFDTTRTTPRWLVMSSQEARSIRTKTLGVGAASLYRFNMDAGDTSAATAGHVVGSYLNMFTVDGGSLVKLILHPYCPKGTILAFTDTLPGEIIPNANIGQLFEFHYPSPEDDIHATLWPRTTREYQSGVYIRGAVAHYFPASMGVITNIANV